jgi:ATP-dependent exoDNAse (exonuclease V) beta subunit
LEGFLDLLIDDGNGGYQVIDYKTDRNVSATEIDRAMETYRLQAACYSLLVREVLGASRVESHFIFHTSDPAEVRTVTDLAAAEADVLEKLRSLRTDG